MSVLPTILGHLATWVDPKVSMDDSSPRRQVEILTIDLLVVLSNVNQHIIEDIVVRSGIVSKCLDNFFVFPNHNVFHIRLIKFIEDLCNNTMSNTLRTHVKTLITGAFLTRLLQVVKDQSALNVRSRNGLLSAAVMFAKVVEPHLETRQALPLKKLVKLTEDEQRGCLGGAPPDRTKTKMVLNKDAEI